MTEQHGVACRTSQQLHDRSCQAYPQLRNAFEANDRGREAVLCPLQP